MKNKKPSIFDVKEYFKDAETIQDHSGDVGFPESNNFEFTRLRTGIVQNVNKKNWLVLWTENQGYAKILTYKTPKFEITKETVIKYQMKEEFPELFDVKLEVREWYKSTTSKSFVFIEKICDDEVFGYGFNCLGEFVNNDMNWIISIEKFIKATPEEVTEALKKEAVRRGYLKNINLVKCNFGFSDSSCQEYYSNKKPEIYFEYDWNKLWIQGASYLDICIFDNGKWATVIQTKTIQEAEELLKELGHEIKIVS